MKITAGRPGMHRLLSTAALVAVTGIIVTGCAGAGEGAATPEEEGDFVLYASLGLSGTSSTFAPGLQAGMEAAVATVNDNGGLLGREVKLEVENNESVPTTAVSNLQSRLRESTPDLVWAGSTSSETLAMLSLTTREEVIALSNGSAPEIGDAATFPYSFSAGVGNAAQANFIVEHLLDEGYSSVGVLTATGAFGEALSAQYTETFEAAGLEVVAETYEPDAVEMDGPLARIDDAGVDAVVFNDFVHPSYVLKSRVKVGMGDVPFVGDISTTLGDISETLSDEEKEGVLLAAYTVSTTAADRPAVTQLTDHLEQAGVDITSGLYIYALAYDTFLAYANAVEAVGGTDVDEVRAAMEADEGDSYELALVDDIGWTEEVHIGSGEGDDLFSLIPVSPLVDGQFQVD